MFFLQIITLYLKKKVECEQLELLSNPINEPLFNHYAKKLIELIKSIIAATITNIIIIIIITIVLHDYLVYHL